MALAPGTRIGPYEILSAVGAGGMGEVYRARDVTLHRDVALKTLLASLVADPERLARFQREAQVLASLNHPNIAQIHGFETGPPSFLVMEFVGGETLAERLARGPIAWKDALPIARQIADALDAAHEQGIIHRDLKPANIKVRDDDTVKVLDFGLAKALSPDGARGSLSDPVNSPTMTSPNMTAMGMILGTAGYMSPEQARGRAVDKRADIWAFGVVLFEMLTGKIMFHGETITDIIAAVVTREPEWTLLPAETPIVLQRLLARCLDKDPKRRLRDIGEARVMLDEVLSAPASTAAGVVASQPSPKTARSPVMIVAATAVIAVAAGALLSRWLWPSVGPGSDGHAPVVASIAAAPDVLSAFVYGFALSPDATSLVYVARTPDGTRRLFRRRLDDPRAEAIAGTEGAVYPFWSPDNRETAFFANGILKKLPVLGGPAQVIADVPGLYPRGSWSSGGDILYGSGSAPFEIYKVTGAVGRPEKVPLTIGAREPVWLPDGQHFLFVGTDTTPQRLFVGSLDGSAAPVLDFEAVPGQDPAVRLSNAGFLVFSRAGVMNAQRFDVSTRTLAGPVVPISDRAGTPRGWFAASVAGTTLVALNPSTALLGGTPGDPVARLKWLDRQGKVVGELGTRARYWTLRLSHDGLRAAVNPENKVSVLDSRTNLRTPLTSATAPVWSYDDRDLFARTERGFERIPATGEGASRLILAVPSVNTSSALDASPDGKTLLVQMRKAGGARSLDLHLVNLADGTLTPFLTTDADECEGSFSPNGQWIAYAANPTGRREIYVRAVSGNAASIQVSADGGEHPMWRGDGKELFFLSNTDEIMSVDMSSFATSHMPGERRRLFQVVMNDIIRDSYPPYGVTPDGQRFLVNVPEPPEPLTIIQRVDRLLDRR